MVEIALSEWSKLMFVVDNEDFALAPKTMCIKLAPFILMTVRLPDKRRSTAWIWLRLILASRFW